MHDAIVILGPFQGDFAALGALVVSVDESPGKVRLDKIAGLKPAFKNGGTITAMAIELV